MAILDTDFLIDLGRKTPSAVGKLKELEGRGESLATTYFSEFELFVGVFKAKDNKWALKDVLSLLQDLPRIPLEEHAARLAARIFTDLKNNPIGTVDIFIASITLAGNDILITKNKKHFENIPGLEIEDW